VLIPGIFGIRGFKSFSEYVSLKDINRIIKTQIIIIVNLVVLVRHYFVDFVTWRSSKFAVFNKTKSLIYDLGTSGYDIRYFMKDT
jgi:hypothetical protein